MSQQTVLLVEDEESFIEAVRLGLSREGFAVEVVTGSASTQFIAVDPGMFADGFVEVTGIEPGTAVVVPS